MSGSKPTPILGPAVGDQRLERHIGDEVTWTMEKRGRVTHVFGTIDRAGMVPGMVITTDEGTFPACRFRIKPTDGSRAVWTCAFAYTEQPGQDKAEGVG